MLGLPPFSKVAPASRIFSLRALAKKNIMQAAEQTLLVTYTKLKDISLRFPTTISILPQVTVGTDSKSTTLTLNNVTGAAEYTCSFVVGDSTSYRSSNIIILCKQ